MQIDLGRLSWAVTLAAVLLAGCSETDEEPFKRQDGSINGGEGLGEDAGNGIVDPGKLDPECSETVPCPAAQDMCQQSVCSEGKCVQQAAPDGTGCDDGMVCTTGDICSAGLCKSAPRVCDDGIFCSLDSCDESMNGCVSNMAACACRKDTDCQDDNPCNGIEICNFDTNRCAQGDVVDCSGLDSVCNTGQCSANDGTCRAVPRPNGTTCDDQNKCSQADSCMGGVCVGENPIVCSPIDQCHNAGTCNPLDGKCTTPLKAGGVACEDGSACTQGDVCKAGVCTAGVAKTCVAASDCHTVGTCNPANGSCSTPTKPNGTTCNDSLTCTATDKCMGGTCTAPAISCDDMIACTQDSCSETQGGCMSNPSQCACTKNADCDDGNACNGIETCNAATLTCKTGTAVSCTQLTNGCQVGVCNPSSGQCYAAARPDGIACDDGSACTRTDACLKGVCAGANPIVCTAQDVCHAAGTCNPATGMCSNPNAPNGTTCDDTNACTRRDTCQSGQCSGANPVVCLPQDQCHSAGTCDPSTGACSNPQKQNGTMCSDGNLCTQTDTCQAGACSGSNDVTCRATDQCHNVGTCDPGTGNCSNPAKTNGSTCDDQNACSQTDTCQAGACAGSNPKTCTASDQCHSAGVCDSITGICSNPAKVDGVSCNDMNACTQTDTCQAGACAGGNPKTCTASDQCHSVGVCNMATGVCSNPAKMDGSSCNDGKVCTPTDTCTAGACGGAARSCDDGIVCTQDSCSEAQGGCVNNTSACGCTTNANCDDQNPCNGAETCNLTNLTCVPGTSVNCSAMNNACNVGTCNQATGACQQTPKANGTSCSDGSQCTQTDTCQTGTCTGANPVVCPMPDQCHNAGTCNPATGVCSNPAKSNGTACSDSNACTNPDTCQSGTCSAGTATVCSAQDQCHVAGVCNTSTGVCTDPEKIDGTICSDANACTNTDRCQGGVCNPGTQTVCTAQDQCHVAGVCAPATGVCSDPAATNGTTCNDADLCTATSSCQTGNCVGAGAKTCSPLDQCHVAGTCDPATGNCSNPNAGNGTSCVDGDSCTTGDVCTAGVCDGTTMVCDSPPLCQTGGACSGGSCTYTPLTGTACTDGNACTGPDSCQAGSCAGTSYSCSTPPQCHTGGTCDGTGGCSYTPTTGGTCVDGNACTTADKCSNGTCSGTAIVCNSPPVCHTGGACSGGSCNYTPTTGGLCSDNDDCTISDVCTSGSCGGTRRANVNGDWNTTPDAKGDGVLSVHSDVIDDSQKGQVAVAGTFTGSVMFTATDSLTLAATDDAGAYFVVYSDTVKNKIIRKQTVIVAGPDKQSGAAGFIDVRDMAVGPKQGFVLVGRAAGDVAFGVGVATRETVATSTPRGFVASFDIGGNLLWLRLMSSSSFVAPRTVDVFVGGDGTIVEDGSVIVGGLVSELMNVEDETMKVLATASGTGTFATHFAKDGTHRFTRIVADQPLGRLEVAADGETGLAGFIGTFQTSVTLSDPAKTSMVITAAGDNDVDVVVFTYSAGDKLVWARGIGGPGNDQVGGIVPFKGFPVFVGVVGNAGRIIDDTGVKWDLRALSGTTLHAHLIAFKSDGSPAVAALVGSDRDDVGAHDLAVDAATGDITTLGWFTNDAVMYGDVGFASGTPPGAGITIKGTAGVNLFSARFQFVKAKWGVLLRGAGAGIRDARYPDWDAQVIVHPTEAATAAGMFSAAANFGDKVVDNLTPANDRSFFLSHYNSEAEYDYCQ